MPSHIFTEVIMDRVGYTGTHGRLFRMNYSLVLLNLINLIFDPLQTYLAYYYDLINDLLQAYTLYDNCHPKYVTTSLILIVMSYIVTVFHLMFLLDKRFIEAMKYPLIHS